VRTSSLEIASRFRKWIPLQTVNKQVLPPVPAVYVLKHIEGCFPRLIGESDILKIGATTNLLRRIIREYVKGAGGETTKRIHRYLMDYGYMKKVELGFAEFRVDKCKPLERELLQQYEEDHHELPPWNRSA